MYIYYYYAWNKGVDMRFYVRIYGVFQTCGYYYHECIMGKEHLSLWFLPKFCKPCAIRVGTKKHCCVLVATPLVHCGLYKCCSTSTDLLII